jgi:hypothetical protein
MDETAKKAVTDSDAYCRHLKELHDTKASRVPNPQQPLLWYYHSGNNGATSTAVQCIYNALLELTDPH